MSETPNHFAVFPEVVQDASKRRDEVPLVCISVVDAPATGAAGPMHRPGFSASMKSIACKTEDGDVGFMFWKRKRAMGTVPGRRYKKK
jgi:hypothetical protein